MQRCQGNGYRKPWRPVYLRHLPVFLLCLNYRLRVFLHIRCYSWVISLFNCHSLSTRASPPLPSFYAPPSLRVRSLAHSLSSAASVRCLFLFCPSSSPLVSALILPCPSPFICSYPLLHLSLSSFFVSPLIDTNASLSSPFLRLLNPEGRPLLFSLFPSLPFPCTFPPPSVHYFPQCWSQSKKIHWRKEGRTTGAERETERRREAGGREGRGGNGGFGYISTCLLSAMDCLCIVTTKVSQFTLSRLEAGVCCVRARGKFIASPAGARWRERSVPKRYHGFSTSLFFRSDLTFSITRARLYWHESQAVL